MIKLGRGSGFGMTTTQRDRLSSANRFHGKLLHLKLIRLPLDLNCTIPSSTSRLSDTHPQILRDHDSFVASTTIISTSSAHYYLETAYRLPLTTSVDSLHLHSSPVLHYPFPPPRLRILHRRPPIIFDLELTPLQRSQRHSFGHHHSPATLKLETTYRCPPIPHRHRPSFGRSSLPGSTEVRHDVSIFANCLYAHLRR